MIKKLLNFFKDEEGAGLVEYALLVVLIAVASIITLTALGGQISAVWTYITGILGPLTGGAA